MELKPRARFWRIRQRNFSPEYRKPLWEASKWKTTERKRETVRRAHFFFLCFFFGVAGFLFRSWGSSPRNADGRARLLLPHLGPRPHPERWRHFLQVSGESQPRVIILHPCQFFFLSHAFVPKRSLRGTIRKPSRCHPNFRRSFIFKACGTPSNCKSTRCRMRPKLSSYGIRRLLHVWCFFTFFFLDMALESSPCLVELNFIKPLTWKRKKKDRLG